MNEEMIQQVIATAGRLATAAEALDRVLEKLDAQQEALNAKVDRIVAAVEERAEETSHPDEEAHRLQERVAELQKANEDLKAQASRAVRKTLSPLANALLSKTGSDSGERFDPAVLDKSLQALTVEQRIAVKAEMARAGLID